MKKGDLNRRSRQSKKAASGRKAKLKAEIQDKFENGFRQVFRRQQAAEQLAKRSFGRTRSGQVSAAFLQMAALGGDFEARRSLGSPILDAVVAVLPDERLGSDALLSSEYKETDRLSDGTILMRGVNCEIVCCLDFLAHLLKMQTIIETTRIQVSDIEYVLDNARL